MLKKSVEDTVTKTMRDTQVHKKTIDLILNNVRQNFSHLAVVFSKWIAVCSEKEMSELCHRIRVNVTEHLRGSEECSKDSELDTGGFGFVFLSPFTMGPTENLAWHRFKENRKL